MTPKSKVKLADGRCDFCRGRWVSGIPENEFLRILEDIKGTLADMRRSLDRNPPE